MKRYSAAAWLAAPLFAGLVLAACGDDKAAPGSDVGADTSTPDTTGTDTTETDTSTLDVSDPCAGKTLCANIGERSCAGTPERILECQVDNTGCLVLTTLETCDVGEACEVESGSPTCIDPCAGIPESSACDTANARRCSGDTLETCTANTDGCLVFTTTADCAAGEATNACGTMGETVACIFDVCKGASNCTPGAACDGDTLNTCSTNAFGCLVETSFDCAGVGSTCDADTAQCNSSGDPCDGVAAEFLCDPSEGSMCNPADVFQ
jgi:hypothetical protein